MSEPTLCIGLGCDRGTPYDTVATALDMALAKIAARPDQIVACATITQKADEPSLIELAKHLEVPLLFFRADELAQIPVANPSETVLRYMGTPSVSEAAAILAAGGIDVAELILEKFKYRGPCGKNATVSIARSHHKK